VFDAKWKKIAADTNLEGSSKNKQSRAKILLFYKTLIILYNIYYTQFHKFIPAFYLRNCAVNKQ